MSDPVQQYLDRFGKQDDVDPVESYLGTYGKQERPETPGVNPLAFGAEFALDTSIGAGTGAPAWLADVTARAGRLGNILTPGQPFDPLVGWAEEKRDNLTRLGAEAAAYQVFPGSGQQLDEGDPGGGFLAGNIGANLGLEGAMYVMGGGALRSAAGMAGARMGAGPFARALQAMGTRAAPGGGMRAAAGEALKDAAAVAPLDLAASIDPETSMAGGIATIMEMADEAPEGAVYDVAAGLRDMEGGAGIAARAASEVLTGGVMDVGIRSLGVGARAGREAVSRAQYNATKARTEAETLEQIAERIGMGNEEDLVSVDDPAVLRDLRAAAIARGEKDPFEGQPIDPDQAEAFAGQMTPAERAAKEAEDAVRLAEEELAKATGDVEAARVAVAEASKIVADEAALDADDFEALLEGAIYDAFDGVQPSDADLQFLRMSREEFDGIVARSAEDVVDGLEGPQDVKELGGAAIAPVGLVAGAEGEDWEERGRNALLGMGVVGMAGRLRRVQEVASGKAGRALDVAVEGLKPKRGDTQIGAGTFRPRIANVIEAHPSKKPLTAAQWRQHLFSKGQPKGFKLVEDRWYGISDFLDHAEATGKVITKDRMMARIESMQPEMTVMTFVGPVNSNILAPSGGKMGETIVEIRGPTADYGEPGWNRQGLVGDPDQLSPTGDPMDSIQDPDARNYREIVISLNRNANRLDPDAEPFTHEVHTGQIPNPATGEPRRVHARLRACNEGQPHGLVH